MGDLQYRCGTRQIPPNPCLMCVLASGQVSVFEAGIGFCLHNESLIPNCESHWVNLSSCGEMLTSCLAHSRAAW